MEALPFEITTTAVTGDTVVVKEAIASFFQGAWDFLVFIGTNFGVYIALGAMCLAVVGGLLYRFLKVKI